MITWSMSLQWLQPFLCGWGGGLSWIRTLVYSFWSHRAELIEHSCFYGNNLKIKAVRSESCARMVPIMHSARGTQGKRDRRSGTQKRKRVHEWMCKKNMCVRAHNHVCGHVMLQTVDLQQGILRGDNHPHCTICFQKLVFNAHAPLPFTVMWENS